jgi:predicted esterase
MMGDPRLAGGGDHLVYRWQPADEPDSVPVILLHGHTGDETVMWVVTKALPTKGMIVAPRGLYLASEGGYSWTQAIRPGRGTLDDLAPSVLALSTLIDELEREAELDRTRMILVGFSQGAALAFAAAGDDRLRPQGIVALAGFLPEGAQAHLSGMPVYWGHGTQDTRIPIEEARGDVERLWAAGARVEMCEADVGHRVGVECMRGLHQWWEAHFS